MYMYHKGKIFLRKFINSEVAHRFVVTNVLYRKAVCCPYWSAPAAAQQKKLPTKAAYKSVDHELMEIGLLGLKFIEKNAPFRQSWAEA
jgi:hypothetical protein